MKKVNLLYMFAVLVVGFFSCEDDFVPEDTAAAEFAGDWFYQVQDETGAVFLDYQYHDDVLMTYNTAENLANEVWIDDQGLYLYFKSKFTLTGDPSNFASQGLAINHLEFYTPNPATEAGVLDTVEIDYGIVGLTDGKIIKDAATVWQDRELATADSIYFKTEFYTANFYFTSVLDSTYTNEEGEEISVFSWQENDPLWEIDEETREVYVVSGHRKTGWEVYIE